MRRVAQATASTLVVLLMQFLVAGTITAGAASAASNNPVGLTIRSVTDIDTGIPNPVRNDLFTVEIDAVAADGSPAEFPRRTPVTLEVVPDSETGTGRGVLSGTTVGEFAAHSSHATIAGARYSLFENGVTLRVKTSDDVAGTRNVDVQAIATKDTANPGVAKTVVDEQCPEATPLLPTCSKLVLPNGANGTVQLFEGSCVNAEGSPDCHVNKNGSAQALIVNAVADFKRTDGTALYTRTAPATMIILCDKTLCEGKGVTSYTVQVDITDTPDRGYVDATSCPAKGVLGPLPPDPFCVDYVQSHRDFSGDLVLYVLFADDVKFAY